MKKLYVRGVNNTPLQGTKKLVQPYRLYNYYQFKLVNEPDYFREQNIGEIKFVSDEEYGKILDKVNKTVLPHEIVDAQILLDEEEVRRKEQVEAQAEHDEKMIRESEIRKNKK